MGSTPIYSIPFAEPSDLVRDWPSLSEDVADAVEAALDDIPVVVGIGTNAVESIGASATTTSSSFQNTTAAATITPSTNTSKILIIASASFLETQANSDQVEARVNVDSGTAPGVFANHRWELTSLNSHRANAAGVFLHSPATTDARTYTVQFRRASGGGTVFIDTPRIVVIEVAA
jgi:hypothetical protein